MEGKRGTIHYFLQHWQ